MKTRKAYFQLPVFWKTTGLLRFCSLLETLGRTKLYPPAGSLFCPSAEDWGGPGRSCWGPRVDLGLGRWVGSVERWRQNMNSLFERLSFVVVRSPWLRDSHRARNNFCVLLKRIQSVFQIRIECVCLKNYFLCKSCRMCEMICLSNCPSKETQA